MRARDGAGREERNGKEREGTRSTVSKVPKPFHSPWHSFIIVVGVVFIT